MVNELIEHLKECVYENKILDPEEIKEVIDILENNILIPKSGTVYQVFNDNSPFGPIIEEEKTYNLNAWELLHLEECNIFRTEEEANAYTKGLSRE